MSTRVKICGITNLNDALAADEAGVDALGFIFYAQSPRFVTVEQAAEIAEQISPFVMRVGVFVNAPEAFIRQAIAAVGLAMLQFHGDEKPEDCTRFGLMSMKAFRMRDAGTLAEIVKYPTDAYLLDAYAPTALGGTGQTFNWDLALAAQKIGKPIFISGGLTPDNVAEAIQKIRPFGVDVSSGVESAPGKKDHRKMEAFVKAAKNVKF